MLTREQRHQADFKSRRITPVVKVLNLATGEWRTYVLLTPREAVIAAHAQSQGDFNTWDYQEKYKNLVRVSDTGKTLSCGDCSCVL